MEMHWCLRFRIFQIRYKTWRTCALQITHTVRLTFRVVEVSGNNFIISIIVAYRNIYALENSKHVMVIAIVKNTAICVFYFMKNIFWENLIVIDWSHMHVLLLRLNLQYIPRNMHPKLHLVVFCFGLIQRPISRYSFPPQFQLGGNFLLSSTGFCQWSLQKSLHMTRQLLCRGMLKSVLWYCKHELNYTKTNLHIIMASGINVVIGSCNGLNHNRRQTKMRSCLCCRLVSVVCVIFSLILTKSYVHQLDIDAVHFLRYYSIVYSQRLTVLKHYWLNRTVNRMSD